MDSYELFLKYNYAETKEMGLHFLTVVTAVLVFSINFAEKVFDFKNATRRKRVIVILGWCSFLFSIILCGLGLTSNALAGGGAAYKQNYFSLYANVSYLLIIGAGIFFILGLLFLILSAIATHSIKVRVTE